MTNILPQSPDNNQGPWALLENATRAFLNGSANEAYVISGGFGTGGTGSNGMANTIANGQVTVPAVTWKVIIILPKGDNDVSRVTTETRTIAVIMPNVQGIRSNPWQQYLVTVDDVEALTGLDFFSNVPGDIQAVIESRLDAGSNSVVLRAGNRTLSTITNPNSVWLPAADLMVNNLMTDHIFSKPE
jgi:endonuclease G